MNATAAGRQSGFVRSLEELRQVCKRSGGQCHAGTESHCHGHSISFLLLSFFLQVLVLLYYYYF